jgi:serine/threonine-protein kinase HipA
MKRALSVWWSDAIVGTLRLDVEGGMVFEYDAAWLADTSKPPLSMSLPKRPGAFKRRACRPFFAGLLPEEGQLEAVARKLGLTKTNDFGLLEALGGDVAGALTLWPPGDAPPAPDDSDPKPLDDDDLASLLEALPSRPLLAGQEGLRLSLAGAQAKLPVVVVGGRIALPVRGQPTTHILKPPIQRFPATTENEALMMGVARAVGLSVATVEARAVSHKPYVLVTRYDRRVDDSGSVSRLHQEDFCQAMGIPPEQKYAAEGGPTFKKSFELLRGVATRPAVEVLKLLDAAIFNAIIGNADAHGKNFSLLYRDGEIVLAPLYDLVCTVAYEDLSTRFAMKFAKAATLDEITRKTWTAFSADAGLGATYVRRRVKELADAVRAAAPAEAEALGETDLDRRALANFTSVVRTRAEQVRKTVLF